jgi:hypothetical protein
MSGVFRSSLKIMIQRFPSCTTVLSIELNLGSNQTFAGVKLWKSLVVTE